MRMLCAAAVKLAALSVGVSSVGVQAQTSAYVEYCQSLRASYRQAVADGKEANAAAGEAGANCPTNPNGSIPVFERILKDMKVELPKRPG
jgi:hypothetical protein